MKKINVVIYGATGSIGNSVLSVIKKNQDKFNLEGITCNNKLNKLIKIADQFKVRSIGYNEKSHSKRKYNTKKYQLYRDISEFDKIVSSKTNIIIYAISGIGSIDLILKIIKKGKKIGLANKECIISFGKKILLNAKKFSSEIVPLDSEHNSIYHLLNINFSGIEKILITASGGPFLNLDKKKFDNITPKEALKHPIWKMGKKISIDSATMMNKALEIIEAKYLFNLRNNQISAIIHPQSIVHAIINYKNGVSTALMYKPDMKVPISSLFSDFNEFSKKNIDVADLNKLDFFEIDESRFPAFTLVHDVLQNEGLYPNVFNYLNELLVDFFLKGKIKFTDIVDLNRKNMELIFKKNANLEDPSIKDIKNINNWIDKNICIPN